MSFLRKSVVWLTISALPLLLLALAANIALQRSFGSPEPIKQILSESGVYGSAIDTFLEATDNPNEESGQGISVDNPVVRDAFKKSFSPQLVENSAENFIDSLYDWLDGKTEVPAFRIDLAQAKATFVNEVAAGAEARAASLPACPRGQTAFEDPFSATCLPRGVSPAVAGDKIRQELAGGEEKFLKDPVITADTFKNKEGKPVFSGSSQLPENYQRIKKVPLVLAFLAVAAILTVIFLSPTRRQGLKRVGLTLLVVGIVLTVLSWATVKVVNNSLLSNLKLENKAVEEKFETIAKGVSENTGRNFMLVGGAYAALGAVAIAGAIFISRRTGQAAAVSTSPKKAAKPKPKP